MSKKKNKFDLTKLVQSGDLSDGQELFFVSDPSKTCKIQKQPNGECKVFKQPKGPLMTVHAFATECLGTEPPEHASRWLRTAAGKTLYELWHSDDVAQAA